MTPQTEAQFAARREESTRKIVAAAMTLFARHGYEKTSVRMIAEEAEVSQGLLYNYFTSKADLLRAIAAAGMAEVERSFDEADGPGSLLFTSVQVVQENSEFWRLFTSLRHQPEALGALQDDLPTWRERILTRIEALLPGGPNTHIDARLLFALIDGIAQHYLLEPDTYPLETVLARALQQVVHHD